LALNFLSFDYAGARRVTQFRLEGLSTDAKAAIVAAALREHETRLLNAFAVINPAMVGAYSSPFVETTRTSLSLNSWTFTFDKLRS
jgi:hypothetical protein